MVLKSRWLQLSSLSLLFRRHCYLHGSFYSVVAGIFRHCKTVVIVHCFHLLTSTGVQAISLNRRRERLEASDIGEKRANLYTK